MQRIAPRVSPAVHALRRTSPDEERRQSLTLLEAGGAARTPAGRPARAQSAPRPWPAVDRVLRLRASVAPPSPVVPQLWGNSCSSSSSGEEGESEGPPSPAGRPASTTAAAAFVAVARGCCAALQHLEVAAKGHGPFRLDGAGLYNEGLRRERMGDWAGALRHHSAAADIGHPQAMVNAASLLLERGEGGDRGRAVQRLEAAAALGVHRAAAWLRAHV